jgi:hypothetical protein
MISHFTGKTKVMLTGSYDFSYFCSVEYVVIGCLTLSGLVAIGIYF